jgi:transposase InsO family protein
VARFGVPAVITSDRGTQFTSQLWSILCRKLGITHTTTSAYHPQSNGLVERAHRQLKEGLKTRLASHEWPAHLPWVLLGMRTSPKDDSAISSAELVYGAPLVLPGEFVDAAEPPAADFLEHVRPGPVSIPTRPIRRPPRRPTSYCSRRSGCTSGEAGRSRRSHRRTPALTPWRKRVRRPSRFWWAGNSSGSQWTASSHTLAQLQCRRRRPPAVAGRRRRGPQRWPQRPAPTRKSLLAGALCSGPA